METEPLGQFGLRQSQAPAGRFDVHAHRYMRTSICAQAELCVQEFGAAKRSDYAQRMKHFAHNVAMMAKEHGGQTALGDKIGVHQSTISKWIGGGKIKSMDPVHELAALAGVSTDQFLDQPLGAGVPRAIVPPQANVLMLPVALPSVDALEAMFSTMLVGSEKRSPSELARRLAEGLPRGLSQAIATRPHLESAEELQSGAAVRSPSTHLPEGQ